MLFVLFGLSPGTDITAHLFGFLGGLILGVLWLTTPARWQNSKTNFIAGAIWLGLVLVTACMAASAGK